MRLRAGVNAGSSVIASEGVLHLPPHARIESAPAAAHLRNSKLYRRVNLSLASPGQRKQPLYVPVPVRALELQ
jgi:hypothetical protein